MVFTPSTVASLSLFPRNPAVAGFNSPSILLEPRIRAHTARLTKFLRSLNHLKFRASSEIYLTALAKCYPTEGLLLRVDLALVLALVFIQNTITHKYAI